MISRLSGRNGSPIAKLIHSTQTMRVLQDAARDQLLKLRLKQLVVQGQPVQVEAALTFQFSTSTESSPTVPSVNALSGPDSGPLKPVVVSSRIANSLRERSFAPVYPQDLKLKRVGGTVELTAIIGKRGEVVSLTPINSPNDELTSAAISAVQKWAYRPYILNGTY
jgi:TonB family protein